MACDLIANLDMVRVTKVDSCGVPVPGPSAFVSECNASVQMAPALDTPDDIIYRAANGTVCGVKRGCPTLLGYDTTFTFYQVSPQMLDVLTGQPVVLDASGEPVGSDSCAVQCSGGFALEFWAELIGDGACATDGTQKYLYVLLPWISNAHVTDLTIGSEQVSFGVLGQTRAGGGWGTGPYNVVDTSTVAGTVTPGPMLTPLGPTCHRRMQTTTIAPPVPDPACDYLTVPTPTPTP